MPCKKPSCFKQKNILFDHDRSHPPVEQGHEEAGEDGHLFLLVPGFQQLTGQILGPKFLQFCPSMSQGRGVYPKEGFEGVRLENHLYRREGFSFVSHDTWLDHWSIEK